MKLKRDLSYTTELTNFDNFKKNKLKCSVWESNFDVVKLRKEFCPKGVTVELEEYCEEGLIFKLFFKEGTEIFECTIDIFIEPGHKLGFASVDFGSDVHMEDEKSFVHLSEKEIDFLVKKYLPIVEKFLDTLKSMKKKESCYFYCYNSEKKQNNFICKKNLSKVEIDLLLSEKK